MQKGVVAVKDLVDTTEMYLRTIYELEEEGITPLRARIAERLEQSGPTVSQTVARMERDNLVVVRPDRSLEMTPEGRELATAVMRKHRLAERLLTDILGLDIHQVHDEACRWEHVMSEAVEERVVAVLEDASAPLRQPDPGLADLGVVARSPSTTASAPSTCRRARPPRPASCDQRDPQVDPEQFALLVDAGITVGSTVTVTHEGGTVRLSCGAAEVTIHPDLAHAVRVEIV